MTSNTLLDSTIDNGYDWGEQEEPVKEPVEKENYEEFDWDSTETLEKESTMSSIFRTVYQPLSGYLRMTPPGIITDLWQGISTANAIQEFEELQERLPDLKRMFPQLIPADTVLDREEYMKGIMEAADSIPNVGNIERRIEEVSGIPLEARSREQRLLRLAGMAGNISPGGIPGKITGSIAAPTISKVAENMGAPEPVADLFGLFGSNPAAYLGNKSYSALKQTATRSGPEALEASVVGGGQPPPDGGLPPTKFGTANEILGNVASEEQAAINEVLSNKPIEPLAGIRPKAPEQAISKQLPPVTKGGEELGIRLARPEKMTDLNLKNRLGSKVSENEIYNSKQTGESLQKIVRKLDSEEYGKVNELYKTSRELNEGVEQIHPDLVSNLMDKAAEIEKIPKPSSVQNQHLNTLEAITKSLAEFEKGQIVGYKPISNQILIDQIQSLRQMVDFDFAHGAPKNIFKPTINAIEDSVVQVSQQTGNVAAAEAIMDAKVAYRDWSIKYNNDYINPYRDLSNRSGSKLFNKITDIDNFNVMKEVIGETSEGSKIIEATQREIAEKQLSKYAKDPKNINNTELQRTFRELESVLEPAQLKAVKQEMADATRRFPNKVRVLKESNAVSPDTKAMQKYTKPGMTAENIESMMNTRSGIKELRDSTGKTEAGTRLFKRFEQQKLQEILRDGKIHPEYTGDQLYNIVNKKSNFDLIAELTSEAEAAELLKAAKKISNRKFTVENVKKLSRGMMKYKALKIAMSL